MTLYTILYAMESEQGEIYPYNKVQYRIFMAFTYPLSKLLQVPHAQPVCTA